MPNVYSTNTTEFHWDDKDGVVRHNGKYGLLLNKPTVPNVSFDSINVTPSTGSDNLPMYVAIADSANAKTNDLKLSMVCWDSAMATKQNKVRLYIRACAGVENVDFGLGELFPK